MGRNIRKMEIERKFLINKLPELNLENLEQVEIWQDYLYIDKFTAIRKRKILKNNKIQYVYTVKTFKSDFAVNEHEKEISKQEYEKLMTNSKFNSIHKKRYKIPYDDGLIIELDIFERSI